MVEVNENIEVAVWSGLAASNGAEHAHISRPTACGEIKYLTAFFTQHSGDSHGKDLIERLWLHYTICRYPAMILSIRLHRSRRYASSPPSSSAVMNPV